MKGLVSRRPKRPDASSLAGTESARFSLPWFIFGCAFCAVAVGFAIWGFRLGDLTKDQRLLLRWILPIGSGIAFGGIGGSLSVQTRKLIPLSLITATGGAGAWLLTTFVLFPPSLSDTFSTSVFFNDEDGRLLQVSGELVIQLNKLERCPIAKGEARPQDIPMRFKGRPVRIEAVVNNYRQAPVPSTFELSPEKPITITLVAQKGNDAGLQKDRKVVLIDSYPRRYDTNKPVTNAREIERFIDQIAQADSKRVLSEHILVGDSFDNLDQVLGKGADLIIIHLSAFFLSTNDKIDLDQFDRAMKEFHTFVDYILKADRHVRILVYTREPTPGVWSPEVFQAVVDGYKREKAFIEQNSARVDLLLFPWGAKFTQSEIISSTKTKLREVFSKL